MEFTAFYSEMMPEGAQTSFTVCDAHRYPLRVRHSYWCHEVCHTQSTCI